MKKMTKKEKNEFKRILLEKKERIVHKLSTFINESKEVESNVAQDVVDKAESSYTKEFLLSLSDTERSHLLQIDEALRRLEKDSFGACQLCGKEIGEKRLQALPWTPYCILCQEKAEQEAEGQ
jgi:DnaK suppressor protein